MFRIHWVGYSPGDFYIFYEYYNEVSPDYFKRGVIALPDKKQKKMMKKQPAEEGESRFTGEYHKIGHALVTEEDLDLLYENVE